MQRVNSEEEAQLQCYQRYLAKDNVYSQPVAALSFGECSISKITLAFKFKEILNTSSESTLLGRDTGSL